MTEPKKGWAVTPDKQSGGSSRANCSWPQRVRGGAVGGPGRVARKGTEGQVGKGEQNFERGGKWGKGGIERLGRGRRTRHRGEMCPKEDRKKKGGSGTGHQEEGSDYLKEESRWS